MTFALEPEVSSEVSSSGYFYVTSYYCKFLGAHSEEGTDVLSQTPRCKYPSAVPASPVSTFFSEY